MAYGLWLTNAECFQQGLNQKSDTSLRCCGERIFLEINSIPRLICGLNYSIVNLKSTVQASRLICGVNSLIFNL